MRMCYGKKNHNHTH